MMANNLFVIILIKTANHSLVSNIYFAKNMKKGSVVAVILEKGPVRVSKAEGGYPRRDKKEVICIIL
jgi:hypothetical protein